ncbi:MAG: transposase [Anaerolineae bacterium]|nr:transposase [Anaerolineae bacterium]
MPQRKVSFYQDGVYHIYNRGAGRQNIFREARNYIYLLKLLKTVMNECQISVIAYCLLPNHYHWLLQQNGEVPVSKAVARVFGSYSQAFNKTYQRTGTLFEGNFKAIEVDSESYFLALCRYIHRNPVQHGFVAAPEDWPYSNYLEWMGQRAGTLVDRELVREYFPTSQLYAEFINAQEDESFLNGIVQGGMEDDV